MLKEERLLKILKELKEKGIVKVNDIKEKLKVSDMTVRRDLKDLEAQGKLIRIHGGAQSVEKETIKELSNSEKQTVHIEEKEKIAIKAASLVEDGDTIFIGPGTTLEALAKEIIDKHIRVVTNSLHIFDILKDSTLVDLVLLGGEYRSVTGAFVGSITQQCFEHLSFSKSFISANGIVNNQVSTYNESEGIIQSLAFDNSVEKYLLVDHSKFEKFDFYTFYPLKKIHSIITDSHINSKQFKLFSKFVNIIVAKK